MIVPETDTNGLYPLMFKSRKLNLKQIIKQIAIISLIIKIISLIIIFNKTIFSFTKKLFKSKQHFPLKFIYFFSNSTTTTTKLNSK